jgi:hypothetical protein
MHSYVDADVARWQHAALLARMERDRHALAHRDEYERLRRRDQAMAQPVRRGRRFPLLAGLRRLRLA